MSELCSHCFAEWGVELIMPWEMAAAGMDEIELLTNGCGRAGLESRLVPDTILGVDISPACRVHDWMYSDAASCTKRDCLAAEQLADSILAANIISIIEQRSRNKFMLWLRLRIAHWYIDAVVCTDLVRPEAS